MDTWGKRAFGGNGHRSMNGDLGQIGTWGNEYLGQLGIYLEKWVFGENEYLGKLHKGW